MNSKEVRSNNKACDKKVSRPVFRHFSGKIFYTCPSNFYGESYAHWFDILRHFQNGQLSFDFEWPNRNVEAIHFVESLQMNYQKQLREANGR